MSYRDNMEFTVSLQKQYANSQGNTRWVDGTIEVEAKSQKDAEAIVHGWMVHGYNGRAFQTIDPRISWDEDCVDLDEEGFEYVDDSFQVVD